MTATYWLIHHAVKLSILPVKPFATRNVKHERVTVQSAGPFLWTRRFCLYAMESAAVYLGVRFGTGRGGSAEVIWLLHYGHIYGHIFMYTLLCMLLHVHQWVFVCLSAYVCACTSVCVRACVCDSVKKAQCLDHPESWAEWQHGPQDSCNTHTHSQRRTHSGTYSAQTHTSASSFFNVFSSLLMVSWPNTYCAPKQTCCIKIE